MSNRNMNLLPNYYLKQRRQHRLDVVILLFYVLVMGAMVWLTFTSTKELKTLRVAHKEAQGRFVQSEKTLDELYAAQSKRNEIFNEVKRFVDLEPRVPRTYLLGELALMAPEDMVFLKIRMVRTVPVTTKAKKDAKAKKENEKAAAAPSVPLEPYVTIFLSGYAGESRSVQMFMEQVRTHPMVRESELKFIQEKVVNGDKVQSFDVIIHIKSEMNISELYKKKSPTTAPATPPTTQEADS